jgi:hypothetical protein
MSSQNPDQERHERDQLARILDVLIALAEWAEQPYQPIPSPKLHPPKPLTKAHDRQSRAA